MSERQTFEDCFASLYDNNGNYISLSKLAKLVEKAQKAEEKGEWKNLIIDYWYDEDDGVDFPAIVGEREETEKEMKARLKQEKLDEQEEEKYNREREKAERETYERLKAKYEGK